MPALLLILALLLGFGFLTVLLRGGRGRPYRITGDTIVLRHSPLLRLFSVMALFGGETLFGLWVTILPPETPMQRWLLTGGAMLLGVVGLALVWEAFQWQLTVTPTHLDCRSPWKPRIRVAREQIVGRGYSRLNGWHVLRFADGRTFRIPAIVPGAHRTGLINYEHE